MKDTQAMSRLKDLERNGELTSLRVLEDAQDSESPLHQYFDWDDSSAAHRFRIEQARTLIRSVRVVLTETKHDRPVIAYVRNPDMGPSESGYISTIHLRSEKGMAREALRRELERAESALRRAYDVADAVGLTKEVDALLLKVRGVLAAA